MPGLDPSYFQNVVAPAGVSGNTTTAYSKGFFDTTFANPLTAPGGTGWDQLQKLLIPQEGQALSPNLLAMLGIGKGQIDQATAANVAGAKTGANARGLEGSSIENQMVESAQSQGSNAYAQLLSQILGLQTGQTSQYAGLLSGAMGQNLQNLLQFLQQGFESSANVGMFDAAQGQAMGLANRANSPEAMAMNLIPSLIGGGSQVGAAALGNPALMAAL